MSGAHSNDRPYDSRRGHSYDPDIHHRRSIRLQGYDYSQAGAYFITICTENRDCLFGNIVGGKMMLNEAGKMVAHWYAELENKFPDIQCDEFVCMPNHVHFIVVNVGVNRAGENRVGANLRVHPLLPSEPAPPGDPAPPGIQQPAGKNNPMGEYKTLGVGEHKPAGDGAHKTSKEGEHAGSPLQAVVQWFKTMTTNGYIRGVKQQGWQRFDGKLWQRNYWEHIVRNEPELNRIRTYILNNPAHWASDKLSRQPADQPIEIRESASAYMIEDWHA